MNPTSSNTEPVAGLTVCYTCMNNMRTIPASLDSIRALADTVVVLDSGSTDGTIEHFREHGIETVHRDFTNPTEQKAHAMSLARGNSGAGRTTGAKRQHGAKAGAQGGRVVRL